MLYNTKALLLHCVFHGIRFKVNEDWVSVIDTLLFFMKVAGCGLRFSAATPQEIRDMQLLHIPLFLWTRQTHRYVGECCFWGLFIW